MAWALLGLDLLESPLPRAREALKAIPKVVPSKRDGHNELIYGSPWYVHRPITPMRRLYPCLIHPLGCEQGSYFAFFTTVAPSSTRSTHSTSAATGVTSKSSSSAVAPPPLQLASATVKDHGPGFIQVLLGRGSFESDGNRPWISGSPSLALKSGRTSFRQKMRMHIRTSDSAGT